VRETIVAELRFGGRGEVDEERMFGAVKSEVKRRCFAVAVRAGRGGRRCELLGERMGVRKRGCGQGRPWVVRAVVRRGRVGVAIFAVGVVGW